MNNQQYNCLIWLKIIHCISNIFLNYCVFFYVINKYYISNLHNPYYIGKCFTILIEIGTNNLMS